MRIGIFGGSFNPVHKGHIHLAECVKKELSIDKVILIPSNIPPHKSSKAYVSGDDRFAMASLAIMGHDGFEVSDYELKKNDVSYTVYTIEYFKEIYPNDELFLLIGSDMLLSFDTWYGYDKILANAALAVVSRYDGDITDLQKKADELSKKGRVFIINAEPLEISSTEIRKKIKKSSEISCYLDKKVVKYIRLKNLYH